MIDIWNLFISDYLGVAVFAFLLTVLLVLIALKLFPKIGLMDRPAKYGLTRRPIPYYGGVVIFLAFVVSILIFVPLERAVLGLLGGAFLIVLIGFIDDLKGLSPFVRLLFHCARYSQKFRRHFLLHSSIF